MPFADDRCAYSFVSFGAAAVDTLLVNCLSTQIIAKKNDTCVILATCANAQYTMKHWVYSNSSVPT